MKRRLFHCTNCNVTLAVSSRRELPNACPVCDAKTRGRCAVRLFEEADQ